MSTILFAVRDVNFSLPALFTGIYQELANDLQESIPLRINEALDAYVDKELDRAAYERRERESGHSVLQCQKCGSRWRFQFWRNGHRRRGLLLALGWAQIELPRVKCCCGGSVQLNLPDLGAGQRVGADIDALVGHWMELDYSLRQMKKELDNGLQTSLGLRRLNERFHKVAAQLPAWQTAWLAEAPPVVMLDAIWVTVMQPTERKRRDKRGRRRVVKRRVKMPVMIALGVWPETGRHKVLDWEVGTGLGEDRASWLRLLNRLETRGLRPHLGLKLFVHDGGAGLIAALTDLFPDVPRQRCVFHKLRNMARAIVAPEGMSKEEKRAHSRQLLNQAALIWQAPTLEEACKRQRQFCRQWQETQPAVVQVLQRDFNDTLTFYQLWDHNRLWCREFLRTTSLLERINRNIRARMRKAGAYHSLTGLLAMLTQTLVHP
jgi:putative transposase